MTWRDGCCTAGVSVAVSGIFLFGGGQTGVDGNEGEAQKEKRRCDLLKNCFNGKSGEEGDAVVMWVWRRRVEFS